MVLTSKLEMELKIKNQKKKNLATYEYESFYGWGEKHACRATPLEAMSESLFLTWCDPPEGRFVNLVWRCLEDYYGIPKALLKQLLFENELRVLRLGVP